MSGGELQMVSISRALVGGPGLVLFDEPSQGLAPKVVQDVMRTITDAAASGRGRARRRPERAHRARHRRPRLCHACRPHRVRGRGRGVARRCASAAIAGSRGMSAQGRPEGESGTRARARSDGSARSAERDHLLHVEQLVKRYYREDFRARPTFTLAARLSRVERAADHRRPGTQRLRQDDAVRAHDRQQRAHVGTRAGRRTRHPPRAL